MMEVSSSGYFVAQYDVFLSFRGPDVRQGFVSVLYHFLAEAGFRVFDLEYQSDRDISAQILQAIDSSEICLAIFSRNYVASSWCLDELARMIEAMQVRSGRSVIPIFLDVTPSDVRLHTNLYQDQFQLQGEKFESEKIKRWKHALRLAANVKGFVLGEMGYAEFCKLIVRCLSEKLRKKQLNVPNQLVGIHDQIEDVMKLLDLGSDGVRFLAIHGMGGLGKTTLAKIVYNKLCEQFDSCSFLEVTRASTAESVLELLNNQIFGTVADNCGITWMKERFLHKNVLVVLDGVDKEDQIEIWAGKHAQIVFGMGSRLIITTRDRRVVPQSEEFKVYEMRELKVEQAIQLLSTHAFGEISPPEAYRSMLDQVVRRVGQLPLALQVTGSFLRNRSINEWELLLEKFMPAPRILEKLKISYDALEADQKEIFLDIACFCSNKDVKTATYMWEACGFYPYLAIEALLSMSLVKIVKNKFWMHKMHIELGRDIVRGESVRHPAKRSRLWVNEEILDVMQIKKGSKNVEAMHLCSNDSSQNYTFTYEEFANMQSLRFLELCGVSLRGNFKNLLPNLLWLSWHHYPLDIKATNICPLKLVILDLSSSIISENWEGWKAFQVGNKLKVLDLTSCKNLTKTPDLSCFPSLERLILEGCVKLTKIDSSIGKLKHLIYLDINGCDSLSELPLEIYSLTSLEKICALDLSLNSPQSLAYLFEISRAKYEVVLGFSEHIEIVNSLHKHMIDAGINVFKIDEKRLIGEGDQELLQFRAIDKAKIYVPIFSRYSSERFLQELSHMVDSQRKYNGQQIAPVFYNVDPSSMKLQPELYFYAANQWVETIRAVVDPEGVQLNDKDSEDGSKWFAEYILNKLKYVRPPVGFENQVKSIKQLLDVESGGVMIVGIHGISGIGKTTLAKAVFDQLSSLFHGWSFLRDIQNRSKCMGLQNLQDLLLRDIVGAENDREMKANKGRLLNKKVLIVLDDVDQSRQIKKLVGKSSSLGSGSRIIITTEDIDVLAIVEETQHGCIFKWPKEVRTFEMRKMDDGEACGLFFRHAFGNGSPPRDKQSVAEQIVDSLGGIPLTLEIFGSFLKTKLIKESEWEASLYELHRMHHHALQDKLKWCYDTLTDETKQVFLDIACFFSGMGEALPFYMWDACGFKPHESIEVLISMSLVKIVDSDKLWMHGVVRNFGRDIVLGRISDPANFSRFWGHDDILDILREKEDEQKKGKANVEALDDQKEKVEALSLRCDDIFCKHTVSVSELQRLTKLRFLELCGVPFKVLQLDSPLLQLRWLSLHLCPPEFPGANLDLSNLVMLDLSRSSIDNEWAGWKQLKMTNLKVLNLTSCKQLTSTPDLSGYMTLERLILEDCANLVQIHSSIGTLTWLKHLNLKGCNALKGLPDQLGSAVEEIVMKGNGNSFNIPSSINNCTSLLVLEIANVKMTKLVLDVGQLKKLERLSLSACSGMTEIPGSLSCLTSLLELDFSRAEVTRLPDSIGGLKLLKVMKLEASLISQLPSSIGELKRLEELYAMCCSDLQGVPSEIGNLSKLRILDLSRTRISSLPSTISQLSLLQKLHLESCNELHELPELPPSLVSLRVKSHTLWKLPDLSKLNGLMDLQLSYTSSSSKRMIKLLPTLIQEWIGPRSVPYFPSNVSSLLLANLEVKKILPNLSNLNILTFLELYSCLIKAETYDTLGVGELDSVEHLSARRCTISHLDGVFLPRKLRVLSINECTLLNAVCDLSGLGNLIHLEISDCKNLTEIRGLGGLGSLEVVVIRNCSSLLELGNLSNHKKLKSLQISRCGKLRKVKGLRRLTSLKHLYISSCGSLESPLSESKANTSQREHLQIIIPFQVRFMATESSSPIEEAAVPFQVRVMATESSSPIEEVKLLKAEEDNYDGVTVNLSEPMDPQEYSALLQASISNWRQKGKKGVWIKLPITLSNLVDPTVKEGFHFHHAEKDYLMLASWLPDTPSTIPANASHRIGVGAFVMNDKGEVLVVQEISGKFRGKSVWKLPTGVVNEGEDICATAIREVKEETGIECKFLEILAFRQSHQSYFNKSDLFFVCMLQPLSCDIQKQTVEILEAQWMTIEEYAAQDFVKKNEQFKFMAEICVARSKENYVGFVAKPYKKRWGDISYMYCHDHIWYD